MLNIVVTRRWQKNWGRAAELNVSVAEKIFGAAGDFFQNLAKKSYFHKKNERFSYVFAAQLS